MKVSNLDKCILFLIVLFSFQAKGQENIPFNHYYLSPVFINSAYTGHTGFFELETNFRQQWTAIEGAPQTIRLSTQLPFGKHFALGLIAINDQRALFNTNQANLNLAYSIFPGKEKSTLHRLSFGVGLGADVTYINNDFIDNPLDPAVSGLSNQSFNPLAQAGVYYKLNNLNVGFSLPFMIEPNLKNTNEFLNPKFVPFQSTTTSVNYIININHEISFTPWLIYQSYNNEFKDGYYQASGFFSYKNNIWLGAGYHSFNGFTFNIGFKFMNKIRAGYAYEMSNDQSSQFGQGSQEFYLNFMSGKRDYLEELRPQNQALITEAKTEEKIEEPIEVEKDSVKVESTELTERDKRSEPVEDKVVELESKAEVESENLVQNDTTQLNQNEDIPFTSETKNPEEEFNEKVSKVLDNMKGIYIVVGAFSSKANAEKYMKMAEEFGYQLNIAYYNKTSYYYTIAQKTNNKETALQKLRSIKNANILDFNESWILEIK
ncbi:PorP/SprF family type IX secretion system membrane protein [Marivirga tractuosa]|uniref:PorP/SprF family type IX secretion system membrane protein n=1 Tax=Marivirga tractuosa TaxID=1006 RepID=UPI0035D04F91